MALGCTADASGIYMTGHTSSTNVFASPGAHQPGYGGGDSDAFFGALESAGCTEAPAQPGAISGDITSCAGDQNTYSVSAVAGATSYTWTLPNGWTGSSSTASIDATAGANGGEITVTANNTCGSSTAQTLSVSVNQAPNQPGTISGDITSCAGDQNTYSVSAITGATSYTWTLPNGWTGNSTTNSINLTAGNNGGTISVTANNSCGSSTAQTLSVSVNQAPAQPGAISGDLTSCAGDQSTYSVAVVAQPGAISGDLTSCAGDQSTYQNLFRPLPERRRILGRCPVDGQVVAQPTPSTSPQATTAGQFLSLPTILADHPQRKR